MSLMRDGLWGIVSKTEAEPEAGTERHMKFAISRSISSLSTRRPNRSCRHMGEAVVAIPEKKRGRTD